MQVNYWIDTMYTTVRCNVCNKLDENAFEELVVCTGWDDYKMKILIIKTEEIILVGEALLEEFNNYAKIFEKTLESYIKETKEILSGNNNEIQFILKDNIFYWKRKMWSLGQINVNLINEVKYVTNFFISLIKQNSNFKKCNLELEKVNKDLKSQNCELKNKLNELIDCKKQMEVTLYKSFILLLNSKKAKIRELKSKIKDLEKKKDPIYDATTDESENESEPKDCLANETTFKQKKLQDKSAKKDKQKNKNSTSKTDILQKNKNIDDKWQNTSLVKKSTNNEIKDINVTYQKTETILERITDKEEDFDMVEVTSPIPSTSKNLSWPCNIGEDEETPDLLNDESECELILEYNEEKSNESEVLTNTPEDSEEEMF